MDEKENRKCEIRESLLHGKNKTLVAGIIILLGVMVLILPYAFVEVMSVTNLGGDKDVNLYQYDGTIKYEFNNGSLNHNDTLSLKIKSDDNNEFVNVEARIGSTVVASYLIEYGTGLVNGTDRYTLFWILLPNTFEILLGELQGESLVGEEFDIIDPIGLFGSVGEEYTMIMGPRDVFMSEDPDITGDTVHLHTIYTTLTM